MKGIWYIAVTLTVLVLVAGMAGCGGGDNPTPTPAATSTVTASPIPASNTTSAPRSTIALKRTMFTPTPTPAALYRGVLPSKKDTASFSSLVRTTAARQNVSGYALLDALRAVPTVSAIDLSEGYDDSGFFSALLLSLSEDELVDYGLVGLRGYDRLPPPALTFPAEAPTPYYYIDVQVILCANDDGSGGAASSSAVTAEFFKQVIDAANPIYADAGMRLVYNPATDFTRRNSTLLNLDFTVPSDINYHSPPTVSPINDSYMNILKKPNYDERQRVASEYRGKMVILLSDGNELFYEYNESVPSASQWKMRNRGCAFSCEECEFVAMSTTYWPGSAEDWGRTLAHEGGHYFHQQHTFAAVTLADGGYDESKLGFSEKATLLRELALTRIRNYILNGHGGSEALNTFDGDGLSDTPPDPGPQFWLYETGDACSTINAVQLDAPLGLTTMSYTISPDRGNVMSYFFRCWNISQHYSHQQIIDMRKSMTDENRWHLIGMSMRLKALDTHVLNNQVYYNAVWHPGTSNDVAVFGWAYNDFLTKATDMLNGGWTMKLLNSYVRNGQVFYDAVWQSGASNDYAVLGWTFTDFLDKCNERYAAGMRLKLLDTYVVDNQVYYNAVWQPGTADEPGVLGWSSADFLKEDTNMRNSGRHLKLLNSYVLNGQVIYDAIWQSGAPNDVCVYGWAYADFMTKANDMHNTGWRLTLLNSFVLNGQIFYNAVWQPGTANDIGVYGWTFADFNKEYSNLW